MYASVPLCLANIQSCQILVLRSLTTLVPRGGHTRSCTTYYSRSFVYLRFTTGYLALKVTNLLTDWLTD